MAVIHDAYWESLLRGAQKDHDNLDLCTRIADSIWRAHVCYKVEYKKIEDKKIKFITKAPVQAAVVKKMPTRRCAGFNINGSACQFKAACGNFCKKHEVEFLYESDSESDSDEK